MGPGSAALMSVQGIAGMNASMTNMVNQGLIAAGKLGCNTLRTATGRSAAAVKCRLSEDVTQVPIRVV